MKDKVLKAYIRDKFGIKVKYVGYGYITLEQSCCGADSYWKLHTDRVYSTLSQIIDVLNAEQK